MQRQADRAPAGSFHWGHPSDDGRSRAACDLEATNQAPPASTPIGAGIVDRGRHCRACGQGHPGVRSRGAACEPRPGGRSVQY